MTLTPQIITCLIIWALMLVLMAWNKWSFGVVSMTVALLLVATKCVSPASALSKFSDSTVIVMGAMAIVAAGFAKTKAIGSIAGLLTKVSGNSVFRCIQMFMLINVVLGLILPSAIARIAIVYPLAVAVCEKNNVHPSKVMFPLGACMLCDKIYLPFNGAAAYAVAYNGFLSASGYTHGDSFNMMDMALTTVPIAVVMVIYFLFFSMKIAPDQPPAAMSEVNLKAMKSEPLPQKKEVLSYSIFIVVCVGLIASSYIGLPVWFFPMAGAMAMMITEVMTPREAVGSVHFSILFLFAGALVMGSALMETGTGEFIGTLLIKVLGKHPPSWFLYLVFWLVVVFLTQFMNNSATATLFTPIAIVTCNVLGCSAKGVVLAVWAASSVAFFTPMATPVMPILMAAGGYDTKSLLKQGAIPAILCTVVSVAWYAIVFPAW